MSEDLPVAGGIGFAGGHGLGALGQASRGEGPDAAGIGGGGAEHGRAFADVTVALASAVPVSASLEVMLLPPLVSCASASSRSAPRCRR